MNDLAISQEQRAELRKAAISVLKAQGMLSKYGDEECENAILGCEMMGLNPILKEVHIVPYWNAEKKKYSVGLIPDHKVFLSRAERSGVWDGYEVKFFGTYAKKTIQKSKKNKDGNWEKYDAIVIDTDPTKTNLSAMITIWRKDWKRPHKSRELYLLEEMKDTAFWQGDPRGMLEVALIREFFPKVFPKDCDLGDWSREVKVFEGYADPDREVIVDDTPLQASDTDLKNAMQAIGIALTNIALVSSKRDNIKTAAAQAYKDKDLDAMNKIIKELEGLHDTQVDGAKAERKPMPETDPDPIPETKIDPDPPKEPVEDPEVLKTRNAISTTLMHLRKLCYDGYDSPERVKNSLAEHLHVEKTEHWEDMLLLCSDLPCLKAAHKHYYGKYQAGKNESADEKKKLNAAIVGICDRNKIDLESTEYKDIYEMILADTIPKMRSVFAVLAASKEQVKELGELLTKTGKKLADFVPDVEIENLGKAEAMEIVKKLRAEVPDETVLF